MAAISKYFRHDMLCTCATVCVCVQVLKQQAKYCHHVNRSYQFLIYCYCVDAVVVQKGWILKSWSEAKRQIYTLYGKLTSTTFITIFLLDFFFLNFFPCLIKFHLLVLWHLCALEIGINSTTTRFIRIVFPRCFHCETFWFKDIVYFSILLEIALIEFCWLRALYLFALNR